MAKKDASNYIIKPKHSTYEYIQKMLSQLGWEEPEFLDKKIISQGELSKLKQGDRGGLTSKKFYRLYKGFQDTATNAATIIYPDLDLTLNEYIPEARNKFGKFMSRYEKSMNSPEEISIKTGIKPSRIRLIYFKTGAPEAYELLLIEKAIGKEPGELFEEYYGDGERPVVGV